MPRVESGATGLLGEGATSITRSLKFTAKEASQSDFIDRLTPGEREETFLNFGFASSCVASSSISFHSHLFVEIHAEKWPYELK